MDFDINIKNTVKDLAKDLKSLQRDQIPYATARALTDTAWNARVFAQDGMVRDLDKVKPFSLNAFKVGGATKTRQTAYIELKPIQAEYLGWAIEGGLKQRDTISIPYRRKRMTRTTYSKWVGRADTFEGTVKGTRGLWQRVGAHRVKLIFAYETQARYDPNAWRYYDDVARAVNLRFPIHWNKQMQAALKTRTPR